MACKPYDATNSYASRHAASASTSSFPRPPAPPQPPLLPLPPQPQYPFQFQPGNRPAPDAKKSRCYFAEPGPEKKPAAPGVSAPIAVAAPSRKREAPAAGLGCWTEADSMYSVSPPPSSVPMPTSLLLTATSATKAPTACAVEVAGGVDVGATDELRRLLRL